MNVVIIYKPINHKPAKSISQTNNIELLHYYLPHQLLILFILLLFCRL